MIAASVRMKIRERQSKIREQLSIPYELRKSTAAQIRLLVGNAAAADKLVASLNGMLNSYDFINALFGVGTLADGPSNLRAQLSRIQKAAQDLNDALGATVSEFIKGYCVIGCDSDEPPHSKRLFQVNRGAVGELRFLMTNCVTETEISLKHLTEDIETTRQQLSRMNPKGGAPHNNRLWTVGAGVHTGFCLAGLRPSTTFGGIYEKVVRLILEECGVTNRNGDDYSDEHIHRLAIRVRREYKQHVKLREQLRGVSASEPDDGLF